jgi:hypothetical protein
MRNKKIKSKELDNLEQLHKLEMERTSLLNKLEKNHLLISLNKGSDSTTSDIDTFKISILKTNASFYKAATFTLLASNLLILILYMRNNAGVTASVATSVAGRNSIGFK